MNRNDIIKRKFSHAFFGYDVEDVDLFLDEIIREMDRIHNELDIESLKAEAARQREEKLRIRVDVMAGILDKAGIRVDEAIFAEAEAAAAKARMAEATGSDEPSAEEEAEAQELEPEAEAEADAEQAGEEPNEAREDAEA